MVPGLHVRPPVQEDFSGVEVAFLGSYIECGDPTLSETQEKVK